MEKLQQIISVILEAPLSDGERISLIVKVNTVANNSVEFDKAILYVADYLDAAANRYDEEVKVYDKYTQIAQQVQSEIEEIQAKPIENYMKKAEHPTIPTV